MTTNGSRSHPRAAPGIAAPLLVWLGVQLAALSIAAAQIPLWARYPFPGNQFAADEMLAVQVIALSLLFPLLLTSFVATIAITAASLPLIGLAGVLSDASEVELAIAASKLSVLTCGLGLLNLSLREHRGSALARVLLVGVSLGVPWLVYLRADSGRRTSWLPVATAVSPTFGVLNSLHGGRSGWSWLSPTVIFGVGLTIWLLHNKLSTTTRPQVPTSGG